MKPVVIIGSGLAGYTLAKEFRKLDTETPLVMITSSGGHFYSKPLLSTALTNKRDAHALPMASAEEMEKQLNAIIKTHTRVIKVHTDNKIVFTEAESIEYEKLVLAVGADPIMPAMIGNGAADVLSINDLEDYARFRELIGEKKHIGILGCGLVGCEFANDLANAGYQVEVVSPSLYPLDTLLPKEMGFVLHDAFEELGVNWHLGEAIDEITKREDGRYVLTTNIRRHVCVDVMLSAIGIHPHTRLAVEAGIDCNRGVLVDHYLQTSAENVYALGDCAEVNGLVLQFVAPLLQCAKALAKTLAGEKAEVAYPVMPIILKSPACPIAVVPPPGQLAGEWQIAGEDKDLKALFYDDQRQLRGFALSGECVKERVQLVKEVV